MFPKELQEQVFQVYGHSLGLRWIFAANLALGGISPKEAVESGRVKDVITLINIAREVKMRERAQREYIDVEVVEEEFYELLEKND